MVDIAFEPTDVAVRSGETVKFVFDNEGAVEHEATFGDQNEQEEHAVEMREAEGGDVDATDESEPGHDGTEAGHDDADSDDGHDEAASLLLQPGESGEVTMTFDDPGVTTTIIGCHVPGHWEAGMRVDVTVTNA